MITKEDFIKKVKRQAGWIDELDAYLLVSIFTDEFGVIYTDLPIEMELLYMWEKLNDVKNIPNEKICSICKVKKPIKDFYKDKKTTDGRTSRCSECACRYMKEWKERKNKLKI